MGSGHLSRRPPQTAEALVDTGASKTIVSASFARAVGIRPLEVNGRVVGIGGSRQVPIGMALVLASDGSCEPQALLVGICDEIAREAGAHILLGHDYMQPAQLVVRPYLRDARCETRGNPQRRRGRAGRKP